MTDPSGKRVKDEGRALITAPPVWRMGGVIPLRDTKSLPHGSKGHKLLDTREHGD